MVKIGIFDGFEVGDLLLVLGEIYFRYVFSIEYRFILNYKWVVKYYLLIL